MRGLIQKIFQRILSAMSSDAQAVSRLCNACGMCCDGVLFPTVQLQPGESSRQLITRGMKLKHKDRHLCIIQPCQAHRGGQCTIYEDRPQRCRLFECRQIKHFNLGIISESVALEKIREARRYVTQANALIEQLGSANAKRSLSKRCKLVLAEPLDAAAEPEKARLRDELAAAMENLEGLLEAEFRIEPVTKE
jgi:Fe-S-cluster containining protein